MPRKKFGPGETPRVGNKALAEQLAAELRSSREFGQPLIQEIEFRTGKRRVLVIWDAWDGLSLQDRTATILRAYDLAEGPESRDRIALASGVTVPEAREAGMLPFEILVALRKGDPVTPEQARQALLEEGGTRLGPSRKVTLRFPSEEDALAARERLIRRFPGSEDVWVIHGESTIFADSPEAAEANPQV